MVIRDTHSAERYLRRVMRFDQEEFWALACASNQRLIDAKLIFLGTVDMCLIHPRDVFRYAIEKNASKIIVAHCHPSGDSEPSIEDVDVTTRLVQTGIIVGIPIIDHIILTMDSVTSFQERKLI